ncbi:hypothetical protein GCM10027176_12180 [Actinoallomurus bryophytorum]|uniref:Uncharacterized protein n=1 Tax=Actinoallomurus bryophytorum TaxID=1490222 RepID=A0A543BTL6_9ACTN|nr:hypothetical protein [Actinoallomurus bryophytorum]TQL88171.1 hypothetical protein FB559_8790 [Actinoallomurus bryophytorum]
MSHVPRHASAYTIDVPGDDTAREIAEVLVGRGHAVVCTAPGGRVVAVDLGPYPSDDEHWWTAAEERFVSGLVEEHGGRVMRSQALPGTARRLLVQGEVVADRTVEQARDQRMAALSREPARVPAPVIVHRLKTPEPSAGPIGEPVTLNGLDDVDWASLSHAYGSAWDVPDLLRRLAANDEAWDEAMRDYFDAVVHQGTCYDSTPRTIGPLVRLACAPRLVPEYRLGLLADLAHVATLDPAGSVEDETPTGREVIARVPDLLDLWPDVSPSARAWLVVLAALEPATTRLSDFRAFRRQVEGPSPALDLALALIGGDDALGLMLGAAAWDERIPGMLKAAGSPRAGRLKVLIHLAAAELAR